MRVRIATLNVWALPEPFSQKPLERLREIARALAELDVDAIAFQEVWTTGARSLLVDAGRNLGLEHSWHTDTSIGGSGLLVLSRIPFSATHFERYVLRGLPQRVLQGDYFGGKGFVRVRLETNAGPLDLVDTHLHARYPTDVAHEYLSHRTGQVVQLSLAMRRIENPLIVVGDFNFREGAPEHRILTGLTGLRDVAAELDRREPTIFRTNPYRANSRKPDRRIDFLFARDGAGRRLVSRTSRLVFHEPFLLDGRLESYSNHAGVLAEVDIEPGPGHNVEPDPEAVALARDLLREGHAEASSRRRDGRVWAGTGLGLAGLAAIGERKMPAIGRRRLLRASLNLGALMALTPTVGFSILSELFVPVEIRAFEELSKLLAVLPQGEPGRQIA